MNSIFTRRSIRQFTEKKVDEKKIENILRAGMQAPSAHNFQPWEFIVVRDEKIKEAIGDMSPYAKLAKKADTLIIALGNMEKIVKDDLWWQQDMSACTQNMLLQITEEGLGGVWLGFYPDEERVQAVSQLFKLPEHIIPFSVIALGYSEKENTYVDRYDRDKVHFDTYII